MSLRFDRGLIPPTKLKYGEPFYIPGKGIVIGNELGEPEEIKGGGGGGTSLINEPFVLASDTVELYHKIDINSLIVVQNGLVMTKDHDFSLLYEAEKYKVKFLDFAAGDLVQIYYSPIPMTDEQLDALTISDLVVPASDLFVGSLVNLSTTKIPGASYAWMVDDTLVSTQQEFNFMFDSVGDKVVKCIVTISGKELETNAITLTIQGLFGMFRIPDFTTEFTDKTGGNSYFEYSAIVGNEVKDFWLDYDLLWNNGIQPYIDFELETPIDENTVEKGYRLTVSGFSESQDVPEGCMLSVAPYNGNASDSAQVYQNLLDNVPLYPKNVGETEVIHEAKFKIPATSGIIVDRFLFEFIPAGRGPGEYNFPDTLRLNIKMEEIDPATIVDEGP